jgi:LysR family transcriptional regulator, nitrogen assimilation regulatory protein
MEHPPISLRRLRYFLHVADAGSFSRASERADIAQAALSAQLARLEKDLGVTLLTRSSRGVELTREGLVLLEHARSLLRQADAAREAVRHASDEVHGSVSVGLPTTVAMILTLPLLSTVRQRWPHIALRLVEGHSGWLQEWLVGERIDASVLFGVTTTRGMSVTPLLDEDLFLVSARDADVPGSRSEIPLKAVASLPLLLPAQRHGLRIAVDRAAGLAGIELNVTIELDSFANIKKAVAQGFGSTILSWAAVADELRRGELVARRIVEPLMTRTVMWATRDDRIAGPALVKVSEAIRERVEELVVNGHWPARLRF